MSSDPGRGPAISAHRGGSENGPSGTYEAYQNASAIGADYVEFDVRQTRDGILVAMHAERARQGLRGRPVATVSYSRLCQLAGFEVPRVAEVMRLLAGRARAHVDLKETGCATTVTRLGLEVLGPARMLVTTGDRVTVRPQSAHFDLSERRAPALWVTSHAPSSVLPQTAGRQSETQRVQQ
jgi:glycerophosphoryl diester phosphodiesterase